MSLEQAAKWLSEPQNLTMAAGALTTTYGVLEAAAYGMGRSKAKGMTAAERENVENDHFPLDPRYIFKKGIEHYGEDIEYYSSTSVAQTAD